MCTVCGCGQGETKIEGHDHEHPHDHPHGHEHEHPHTHADGSVHSHAHPHEHQHDHVEHDHGNDALHAAAVPHDPVHGDSQAPGHQHEHQHAHGHEHFHEHEHSHGGGMVHSHLHPHEHSHGHEHAHDHDHAEAGHGHDHLHVAHSPHDHAHTSAEMHGAHPGHEHDHGQLQDQGHDLHYGMGPAHAHAPGMSQERMVQIEQDILGKNNRYADGNRKHFAEHGIFAVNLVSSPGSGKTTLLVKTIEMLKERFPVAVVEGDQQTSNDADRIRATGAAAIQVNTGKGCHLDAHMVGHALERLALPDDSLLMIENVGNLVCPAAFDLGEAHKVVILSVTEGEDKPLKYPDMFNAADLMILNKVDLLPHLSFDVHRCIEYARRVNPRLEVMQISATHGEGMDQWLAWLTAGLDVAIATRQQNVNLLKKRIAELEAALAAKG